MGHEVVRLMIESREKAYEHRLATTIANNDVRLQDHMDRLRRDDDFDTTEAWEEGERDGLERGKRIGESERDWEIAGYVEQRHGIEQHTDPRTMCMQGACWLMEDLDV